MTGNGGRLFYDPRTVRPGDWFLCEDCGWIGDMGAISWMADTSNPRGSWPVFGICPKCGSRELAKLILIGEGGERGHP